MVRGGIAVLALLCTTAFGFAQTQPPGAGAFFGAAPDQKFDEKAILGNPPTLPKPVTIPDGSMPVPPPRIWTGGVEMGLNGSQGDVDVLNIRVGANADRKTDANLFHTDFLYTLNRQGDTVNQNQALWNTRDEILFKNTPWSLFSALQLEYDQLRPYDLRVGVYGGVGYKWIDTKETLFKTRAGAGAVREMNLGDSSADRWVPEAVFGFDFNHAFTDRQRFVSSVDAYPSLSQIKHVRVRARAAYEILIDPEHCMVLRLGVQERYDSEPGNGQANALNYFATLMFKF
jgi:hypothetical protein